MMHFSTESNGMVRKKKANWEIFLLLDTLCEINQLFLQLQFPSLYNICSIDYSAENSAEISLLL